METITPLLLHSVALRAKKPPLGKSLFRIYIWNEDGLSIGYEKEYSGQEIFNINIARLPHCCGMLEMGNIFLEEGMFSELPDKQIAALTTYIDDYFGWLLRKSNSGRKITRKHLFVANLIPDVDKGSLLVRESFIRTGYFSLVKSFINSNSYNLVEVWISNN